MRLKASLLCLLFLTGPLFAATDSWNCLGGNPLRVSFDASTRVLSVEDNAKTDEGFAVKRNPVDSRVVTYYMPQTRPGQSYFLEIDPKNPQEVKFRYCGACDPFVCKHE